YEVSPISGELNASTVESLKQFQMIVDLEATGKLTAKSMIELRNRWREQEEESSPMMAVSGHAVKRTSSRIAGLFKRS
ncbi:peptidoglycan-binding protein, partial [bacterium]|nr:peptidoglycan-binding protein [bacterium]